MIIRCNPIDYERRQYCKCIQHHNLRKVAATDDDIDKAGSEDIGGLSKWFILMNKKP